MVDLGDISRGASTPSTAYGYHLDNVYVGDISLATSIPPQPRWRGRNTWSAHVPMVIDCEGSVLGDVVSLLEGGQLVDARRTLVADHAFFYDLDDGEYHAASTTSTRAWKIVVEQGIPTVTVLSSGGETTVSVPRGSMSFA